MGGSSLTLLAVALIGWALSCARKNEGSPIDSSRVANDR